MGIGECVFAGCVFVLVSVHSGACMRLSVRILFCTYLDWGRLNYNRYKEMFKVLHANNNTSLWFISK